jgi:DNA-binding winged helix-turn-helix (wHTH) protein/class 3 adenylate cyclase/tetratricopeptide (TPR) repeat protein
MIYRFDDCELDTDLYTFHKGGMSSALESKVFDILLFLIEHRGHVVSKQELLAHLWPNQYISEATLNHAIMAARKAIGDDGRQQRTIRTVRGRGYLFVPVIEVVNRPLPDGLPAVGDVAPVPVGEQPEDAGVGWRERSVTGERKSVTVLSCALGHVGALMEEVGPDVVHQHLQRFLALAEIAVNRYGGTITHFFDDGFRALFGAPVTYEDHARRGVLAALMLYQHAAAGETVEGRESVPDLGLRLGLHTGLVLMGSVGKPSQMTWTAIRGTTDLAICCQEHATPGTILVTEAVRRRVQEVVLLEPWESVARPKSGEPLDVYRVVARRPRRVPLGQVEDANVIPFVDRELELATLHALLRQAEEGRGQVVGVVGEPGIGKSRLLREFCRQLDKERVIYLEGHCLSYGSHTPYFVVIEMLRQEWGIVEGEPPEAIIANVRAGLRQADIDLDERATCLLHLLGVPDTQGLLGQWTPEMIKVQTFSILQQLCFQPNRHLPLLLAVEDLHWVDTTSEALLASLVEQLAGNSVLLLTTYRPGYHPVWMDKSYATQLALSRLTSDDSRCLVSSILDSMNHPELGTDTIVAKADGNPFFLEELTQAFVEQAPTAAPIAVPDTIQTVLAARIDRLAPTEKQLLQTAAVVGRDVPFDLLRALVDLPEDVLRQTLMTLQTAEFLHVKRDTLAQVYSFKHILTQEVAYASLLASTRRELHEQIAHILERDLPQIEMVQPELLAYHYTAAGLYEAAVLAWHRAGQQAMERSAYIDAIAHFNNGLDVLAASLETPTRIQHELALHMALGSALIPLALLADVYCRMGLVDEGLRVIDEALTVRAKTGERFYEAALSRLKGELLLRGPSPDETRARAHFDQALATARQQEARVLELRAAVSLCRFLRCQGDKEPIYDLLYPLTSSFTEGLDSPDLWEARALLEM